MLVISYLFLIPILLWHALEELLRIFRWKLGCWKRLAGGGVWMQVTPKRTNVPGMKAFRGGRYNPYYGYRPRRPYLPPYGYAPYGYGWVSSMDFHFWHMRLHISYPSFFFFILLHCHSFFQCLGLHAVCKHIISSPAWILWSSRTQWCRIWF